MLPLPKVPDSSSVSVARRTFAQVIAIFRDSPATDPVRYREGILPYLLAYSVAFADARNREIGWVVDKDDMEQIARIRALDALDRLDVTMSTESQLCYFHTVVSSAIADACRASDRLGRRGRNRRSAFLVAVEVATQAARRSLTTTELDAIAHEIIGSGGTYGDFYRCRYGSDLGAFGEGGLSPAVDPEEDPEQFAVSKEIRDAIAAHPDRDIREFLGWVLTGEMPKRCRNKNVVPRPKRIVERLGPVLTQLLDIEQLQVA